MTGNPGDEEEVRRVAELVSDIEAGLAAIEDPVDRFKRAGMLLTTWTDQQARISEIRTQVVVALRKQDVPYRKIAEMLSISLVRVQQIEKGLSAGPNKTKKTQGEADDDRPE